MSIGEQLVLAGADEAARRYECVRPALLRKIPIIDRPTDVEDGENPRQYQRTRTTGKRPVVLVR